MCTVEMHIFEISILILNFDVFCMFRTRGFIFKKAVVYTGIVWYVLQSAVYTV
jgi:hypothetical protein